MSDQQPLSVRDRGASILDHLLFPIRRPVNHIRRALRAASYPLQGIWYFLRRPYFYPLFAGRLIPLSIISFLVYAMLFTLAFVPQLVFLMIFHGRAGAVLSATVLVLGEGLVIIQGLFEGFFVDECRVDVFDVWRSASHNPSSTSPPDLLMTFQLEQATLINYGLTDLVAPQRILFLEAPNSVKMLGKPTSRAEYQPWSLVQIVELVVFLPLNLIPYVGVPAFIIITGARLGKLSHHRWYKLRGLHRSERKQEIRDRIWDYTWFGTIAMLLELVPVLSFFFLLTTTAGSAIWAAQMEKQSREEAADGGQEQRPRETAVGHEQQNDTLYRDDPV